MNWKWFIILSTVLVAYANGANDNFKGVATLLGSGTTDYQKALGWATIATLAGSITAFFFATNLVKTFSGKGLVPDALITTPEFLLAVALGAGATVLLATLTGIPISTTYSLTGSLVGAGLVAIGADLGFSTLGKFFFILLLSSPLIAVILTTIIYIILRSTRRMLGVSRKTCVCMGEKVIPVANVNLVNGQILSVIELKSMEIFVDEKSQCQARALDRYEGRVFDIDAQQIFHFDLYGRLGLTSFWRIVLTIFILDFAMYVWYRFNHSVSFLWRFHRVHHSDRHVDVTTASRFHFGEMTLSAVINYSLILSLGASIGEVRIFELIFVFMTQLAHSNIRLFKPLEDFIWFIFVSPSMHRIHHSDIRRQTDSNYGTVFSIWDRLFKTLFKDVDVQKVHFGLKEFQDPKELTLVSLILMPFIPKRNRFAKSK